LTSDEAGFSVQTIQDRLLHNAIASVDGYDFSTAGYALAPGFTRAG
jgi:hypothetical protein